MNLTPTLETFSHGLRELASAVTKCVPAELKKTWQTVELDVRSPPDGSSKSVKLRILAPSHRSGAFASSDVGQTLDRLWLIKDEVFSLPWFGLRLHITREGQCDVQYNYDPACDDDESFYDD